MTLKILKDIGVETRFEGNTIKILSAALSLLNQKLDRHYHSSKIKHYTVESDWSSASYFYSLAAIGKKKMHLEEFLRAFIARGFRLKGNLFEIFRGKYHF